MKSGLKEQHKVKVGDGEGDVTTSTAMKSGLKDDAATVSSALALCNNLYRDEKRTESFNFKVKGVVRAV